MKIKTNDGVLSFGTNDDVKISRNSTTGNLDISGNLDVSGTLTVSGIIKTDDSLAFGKDVSGNGNANALYQGCGKWLEAAGAGNSYGSQATVYTLGLRTQNGTQTNLQNSLGEDYITVNDNVSISFVAIINGIKSVNQAANICLFCKIEGLAVSNASGLVTLIGPGSTNDEKIIKTVIASSGTTGWDCTVASSETTDNKLHFKVTGAVSTNIQWSAKIDAAESYHT